MLEIQACDEERQEDSRPLLSEEWRPVEGLLGLYEVSSLGNVRSLDRWVQFKDGRKPRFYPGVLFKLQSDADGYHIVRLKGKTYKVHRLVALAFVGPAPGGAVVCHDDGDPKNNRADNLRWDTPRENRLDQQRHGTDHRRNQQHCIHGHLLAGENLIAAALKRGLRECRACGNARAHLRTHPDQDFEAEAERYYARYQSSRLF